MMQCRDELSGETGCFLFDVDRYAATGRFFAVSPMCRNLVEFATNANLLR